MFSEEKLSQAGHKKVLDKIVLLNTSYGFECKKTV